MNSQHLTSLFAIQWAYETPHYIEWVYAVVGMAVVGGVWWLCAKLLSKPDHRYGYNEPHALFKELCLAHALSRGQRRLLKQIAKRQNLANSAQIFLRPDLFQVATLSPKSRSQATKVEELAKLLFAEA